jgi:hypothetical protein
VSFTVCTFGGQGVQFSFAFSGPAPTAPNVPATVTGSASAKFRLTGDQIQLAKGAGLLFPNEHSLLVQGTPCNYTTALGTFPGTCFLFAQELTQPNSANSFELEYFGTGGFAFACCQLVSGSEQID